LGLSPPVSVPPVQQEGGREGDREAARQTLAQHLAHTLSEVYGLQPSTDISSLQLSCDPASSSSSSSSAASTSLVTAVAQQLGISLVLPSFLTELSTLVAAAMDTSAPGAEEDGATAAPHRLSESLVQASRLAAHFRPNQPAAQHLPLPLPPLAQHRPGLACLSDCMITLLNSRASINEYFQRVQTADASASCLSLMPSAADWELWAELVSVLEPIRRFAQVLPQCPDTSIGLAWFLADWLVCIYEQREAWDVIKVTTGEKSSVETAQLSPSINRFRLVFVEKCRERFLNIATMKSFHAGLFSTYCQATLLDARTKEFNFFKTLWEDQEEEKHVDDDNNNIVSIGSSGDSDPSNSSCSSSSSSSSSDGRDMKKEVKFSAEVMQEGTGALRVAMKSELQAVHACSQSETPHVRLHRLHRIVDSMFVGKQNYGGSAALGKRKAGEPVPEVSAAVKLAFVEEKMIKYAELELRQYLRLPAVCAPGEGVLAARPLSWWRERSVQFPVTAHFARKSLAMQMCSEKYDRMLALCRQIHEKPFEIEASSSGLLDCVTFLAGRWLSDQHSARSPRPSYE
jgi:hypothetical protein